MRFSSLVSDSMPRAVISRWMGRALLALFSLFLPMTVYAHVGSPHIVFQGKAGEFPVTVVVRQPDVVPGLVDIHIRVLEGKPSRVTALAMHSSTGRKGAPRPDVAHLVEGETNLFSTQLWFMTRGAYGVEVAVEGERGGTLLVPVNSVALERRPMPGWLMGVASGLLIFLALGVILISIAAVRESTLPTEPSVRGIGRGLRTILGATLGLVIVIGAVYGARLWWNYEDDLHQSKVLFRPLQHSLRVEASGSGSRLLLELTDPRMTSRSYRLLPDHGKWIHLFLVGEGDRPAFAHLHPIREGTSQIYSSFLPPMPAGRYRLFADLTHEQGLTQTLTNQLQLLADVAAGASLSDPEDSWTSGQPPAENTAIIGPDLRMKLGLGGALRVGQPVALEASVVTESGVAVTLEPYLRMLGHAVIMRQDGMVFSHVHPAGTLSLAAARKFAATDGGEAAARATDVICGDLDALPEAEALALGRSGKVSFPFVFPSAGEYWVWVQVKVGGRILTGAFRVHIPS